MSAMTKARVEISCQFVATYEDGQITGWSVSPWASQEDGPEELRDSDSGHVSLSSAVILLGIAATGAAAIVPMVQHAVEMLGGAS